MWEMMHKLSKSIFWWGKVDAIFKQFAEQLGQMFTSTNDDLVVMYYIEYIEYKKYVNKVLPWLWT